MILGNDERNVVYTADPYAEDHKDGDSVEDTETKESVEDASDELEELVQKEIRKVVKSLDDEKLNFEKEKLEYQKFQDRRTYELEMKKLEQAQKEGNVKNIIEILKVGAVYSTIGVAAVIMMVVACIEVRGSCNMKTFQLCQTLLMKALKV